ncbi:hypothetical protein LR48_Vigan05g042700 [Vigna angularis]|uniref:Uncharacterized protein n=3 Tax=Phaseolus angularis TaxID=3914 RepID=A0A0L9UJ73_PHAAN|nr:hypothetical protein LR48_Vigan05g042700 [Vigna angularis]
MNVFNNYKRNHACHFLSTIHSSTIAYITKELQKMESSLADMLMKVGVFILVQALVYLILSNSSNIFSKNIKRSHSFRPARSVSIRRMLALISDFPPEGEPSPSPKAPQSPSLQS